MTGQSGRSAQAMAYQMAYEAAASTPDPELPTVTIEDLGILRQLTYTPGSLGGEDGLDMDGEVLITITPTYSGCPAMREMSTDVRERVTRAGFTNVKVRTQLSPAWTSDWITAEGHRKLAAIGVAPPAPAQKRTCFIPLAMAQARRRAPSPACPHCGSADTRMTAQFSATACKSLHRCNACGEPFEAFKPK